MVGKSPARSVKWQSNCAVRCCVDRVVRLTNGLRERNAAVTSALQNRNPRRQCLFLAKAEGRAEPSADMVNELAAAAIAIVGVAQQQEAQLLQACASNAQVHVQLKHICSMMMLRYLCSHRIKAYIEVDPMDHLPLAFVWSSGTASGAGGPQTEGVAAPQGGPQAVAHQAVARQAHRRRPGRQWQARGQQ